MKMDWPPEVKKEKEDPNNEMTIEKLAGFDTDGLDVYQKEKFINYVKENNINVPLSLDYYLNNLDPNNKFTLDDLKYNEAFRAWLHCDFEDAQKYILDKLDFECIDNNDFLNKYKFFNTIASFIFNNESIGFESEVTQREKFVFETLKNKTKENKGSFLLNYLAIDFISVIDKKKFSVQDEEDIDWVPFEIAPRVYAFDSRNSLFALIHSNELIRDSLYISDEKDYEDISSIILSLGGGKNINQEKFDLLIKYFSILDKNNLRLDEDQKDVNDTEFYLFRELSCKYHRKNIKKKTGITTSNLSLIEQRYFIDYLKFVDNNHLDEVIDFNKKYKRNGIRTFLSIEQGGKEMGDKILELGEKLPEDVAQKVFEKYGQIIDNVNKITEFAKTNFTKEIETNPELIGKIENTLYERGKSLLTGVYNEISNKKEVDHKELERDLERVNADTITTLAIFKQAVKNGEKLPVESIEGAVFAKEEAKDIEEDSREEMSLLYDRNYKDYPDKKFFSKVKDYFSTAFIPENNKQKNYFYTFRKDNHIRAFVRFEKKEDNNLYASALNVDDASKNFGLGEAMMDEALSREAKEHILHATCLTDRASNMRYFEKGFISKELEKDEETIQLKLIWDEKRNNKIISKQMSVGELVDLYNNKEEKGSIEIKESESLESLHEYIPEGKALVRCFINKENNKWYAVYEEVDNDYGLTSDEDK